MFIILGFNVEGSFKESVVKDFKGKIGLKMCFDIGFIKFEYFFLFKI